jgi:2-(1,2-epoxy-1,2-dihydrophenyl)acetyl-CoA isomerase
VSIYREFVAEGEGERPLVQEVVAHDALLATAEQWCERASAMPEHAMEMTKPLLRAVADASWEGALALEEFAEPSCFTTEAFAQAVRRLSGS